MPILNYKEFGKERGGSMVFWRDKGIMLLLTLGIIVVFVFLGWVAALQGTLERSAEASGLFLYPILGIVTFVGAVSLARMVYTNNRSIAYRVLITSLFFHVVWVTLVVWAVRHMPANG